MNDRPSTSPAQAAPPDLVGTLVNAAGPSLRAVILYGSRLLGARPDQHSAWDLVVVVTDYRAFYIALKEAGYLPRPVWLMVTLARMLPPNTIAFVPEEGSLGIAKCLVVSGAHLEMALGPTPPDHFLLGRLVQRVAVIWSRSEEDARWVEHRLDAARAGVLTWMAPYLEEPVDAPALGRRLLEVCYQGEVRPEAKDRSHRISDAQLDHFEAAFEPVLADAAASGAMEREGSRYRLAGPVPPAETRRWRAHFRRSKARATARWFKHMVTFAHWLPYIVRKVERHTGRTIRLTRLERALPIVFLWPRAVHVLLTRPKREKRS